MLHNNGFHEHLCMEIMDITHFITNFNEKIPLVFVINVIYVTFIYVKEVSIKSYIVIFFLYVCKIHKWNLANVFSASLEIII